MSIEGLWTVRFASVAGELVQAESGAVVTLKGGQILGGDTWAYFVGSYEVTGRAVALRADISIHFTEGGQSILGGPLVPYSITGTGEINYDKNEISARLRVEQQESAVIIAILTKVADVG